MISRAIHSDWRFRMRVRFQDLWPRVRPRREMGTPAVCPLRHPREAGKATRRCRTRRHFRVHLELKFHWGSRPPLTRLKDSSFLERPIDRFLNACSLEPAMAANSLMCREMRSEPQLPTSLQPLLPAHCQAPTKLLT